IVWTSAETEAAQTQAQAARRQATERGLPFKPKFFTRHEFATITVLADLILPRDERSGSASDAGVPEFMDFMMIDQPVRQTAMRGGLAFIDHLCDARFDGAFHRVHRFRAEASAGRPCVSGKSRTRACPRRGLLQ